MAVQRPLGEGLPAPKTSEVLIGSVMVGCGSMKSVPQGAPDGRAHGSSGTKLEHETLDLISAGDELPQRPQDGLDPVDVSGVDLLEAAALLLALWWAYPLDVLFGDQRTRQELITRLCGSVGLANNGRPNSSRFGER